MRRRRPILAGAAGALIALVIPLLAGLARAQSPPAAEPGAPAQRTFVRDYMAAVSARDLSALKRLVHPASLACVDDTNRDFFDFVFARELRERPVATYRVTRIDPLPGPPPLPGSPALFRYPVRPTHEVQIDFETEPARSTTLVRQIALVHGAWFEVVVCPTAEGVQAFRQRQQAAERQRIRAAELAAAIQEPLLSELRGLLGHRQRLQAIKRYQEQSGADVTTAVAVIDVLEGRQP